jgi:hypothetical protein
MATPKSGAKLVRLVDEAWHSGRRQDGEKTESKTKQAFRFHEMPVAI